MAAVQGQGRGVGDEDQPREGAYGRPPRGDLDARDGEAEIKIETEREAQIENSGEEAG
jgi:hypothetical protein